MRFMFVVVPHYGERPSMVSAREVAESLRRKGHEVRVVPLPANLSTLHLATDRPFDEKKAAKVLWDRQIYLQGIGKIADKDEHVILFHNSPPEAFYPHEAKEVHEYALELKGEEDHIPPATSMAFYRRRSKDAHRLVGDLELPAVRVPFRGPLAGMEAETLRNLKSLKDDRLKDRYQHVKSGVFEFERHSGGYFSIRRTRDAGLLTRQFSERIADELENAASNAAGLAYSRFNKTGKLRSAASIMRRDFEFLRKGGRERLEKAVADAEASLKEFEMKYKETLRAHNHKQFEKKQPVIEKLNRERAEVAQRLASLIQTQKRVKEFWLICKEKKTDPRSIHSMFGLTAKFFRPSVER